MTVSLVPQDWAARISEQDVGALAARLLTLLQPVADRTGGRYEVMDWLLEVQRGNSQLWVAFPEDGTPINPDVAIITEIVQYPRLKALRIVACGGEEKFFDYYPEIETMLLRKFGPETGCTRYEIVGRPGWARVLKRFGPTRTDTITEGDLDGQEFQGAYPAH